MIKNFGRRNSGEDNFEIFGVNLKFTDLQAVIGQEQLKKLDHRVRRMGEIYKLYYDQLHNLYKMIPPCSDEWIPWFVDIYTDTRSDIIQYMNSNGIQTRPAYPQVNKTSMYYDKKILPNSEYVSNRCLFLPSHTLLSNDDIIKVCTLLKNFTK